MSERERCVLWIALGIATAMYVFAPMGYASEGNLVGPRYEFLFKPSTTGLAVDIPRLLVQYAILAGATWLTLRSLSKGKE